MLSAHFRGANPYAAGYAPTHSGASLSGGALHHGIPPSSEGGGDLQAGDYLYNWGAGPSTY